MRKKEQNYLLGAGQELSKIIAPPPFRPNRKDPYSPSEAAERISRQAPAVSNYVRSLPVEACPRDEAVAKIILHPQYLSKSAFPAELISTLGLEAIGSQAIQHQPEKDGRLSEPKVELCTQVFVAGPRSTFDELPDRLQFSLSGSEALRKQLPAIERIDPLTPQDRIKPSARSSDRIPIEIVLHAGSLSTQRYRLDGLLEFALALEIPLNLDHMVLLDTLSFVGTHILPIQLDQLSKFSYIRSIRRLPKLRTLHEPTRFYSLGTFVKLPKEKTDTNGPSVAIFDGGFDPSSGLEPWVTSIDIPSVGAPIQDYVDHGVGVCSAALFGPIQVSNNELPVPSFAVDHYRVLGDKISGDFELLDVLNVIKDTLSKKQYDLVNISLGPNNVCEDTDVSPWSSTLDALFADGKTLAFVAVGNNGLDDPTLKYNRIMAPSDGVNLVGVGAADRQGGGWLRAPYSAVGPGRSPGVVKPDIVAFGGSTNQPFIMISRDGGGSVWSSTGTSFAAPTALRVAGQMLRHMGSQLSVLAVRTLMMHHADKCSNPLQEVGRGLVESKIENLLTSDASTCHIVYQGKFDPKKYKRFQIPEPEGGFIGRVEISVTVAYTCEVDPASPENYTRAGLEVFWRPNSERLDDEALYAKTKSLVKRKNIQTEQTLRQDAHKWETVIKATTTHQAKTIYGPVLDLHYNPRKQGGQANDAKEIPYAMIITVRCKAMPDLYNRVLTKNHLVLKPLIPVIQIPL